MRNKLFFLIVFSLAIFVLTGCSFDGSTRGMSQEMTIVADDIPEEPEKEAIINSITTSPSNQIDAIIAANFPLLDVVTEDNNTAEIYGTTQFNLSELGSILTESIDPEEISEVVDNGQIFIYPDHFVTLTPSEDDDSVLLIEVATETFVKENYSPSFLQTYFTIRLLDSLFGNNWSSNRSCLSGGCYGGYNSKKSTGTSFGTPSRGKSTFRGGGPGFGK